MKAASGSTGLRRHILGTYFDLRVGLFVIAVLLPLGLWLGGELVGVPRQGSMSAYYHTALRNGFVGALFAVAALLVSYRGFSDREDWALNLAAVFLVGVALVPSADPGAEAASPSGLVDFATVHGACAVLFFLCIGYVCLARTGDTLKLIRPEPSRPAYRSEEAYRWAYRVIGAGLILSPLTAFVVAYAAARGSEEPTFVFWLEAFGIWVFSLYWLTKSVEVHQTNAEQLTARGVVRRSAVDPAGPLVQVEPDDLGGLSPRERRDVAAWMGLGEEPPGP